MKKCMLGCLLVLLSLSFAAGRSTLVERNVKAGICDGADPSEITFFPVEGDCTRYIECWDGIGNIFQCDDNLWWHQEIQNCDYPGEYCTWDTIPTVGPTDATTPNDIGTDPRCVDGNPHYWPHPAYCHRYIECFGGHSYEMACPPSLYFSVTRQECVNPEDSECCSASDEC